ncbi:MAG: hypothetical protein WCG43_06270 [Actinomycetes bacterium]|jgi:hypothetical protein
MAIVSFNIEVVAEIPVTINEADRQDGQTYVDLIGDAVQAFMENNDMNALDFQYKVIGDVIGSE